MQQQLLKFIFLEDLEGECADMLLVMDLDSLQCLCCMNWTIPYRGHFYSNREYLISMKLLNQRRQRKERKLVASAPVNLVWMSNLILNEKKICLPPSNTVFSYYNFMRVCYLWSFFLTHLDKNTKRNFLGKAGHNFFATTHVISYLLRLILFPAWRKHRVASQTVSVATDDRLMKRFQSRPTGWFCTCCKKHSDVRVVSTGWCSYKRTLNHIWTHTDGRRGPGRGKSHLFNIT